MSAALHFLERDGIRLHVDRSAGPGPLAYFQHGLCGDARQAAEVFPDDTGFARITLECRGHGTSDVGPFDHLSIATFADDLAVLIGQSGEGPAVVGGISMGAAIALRVAVRRPDLVRALILARPAWVVEAAPLNMRPNAEVGALLASGDTSGRERFEASATATILRSRAPDNLASLLGFFERLPLDVTAELLTRISRDGPGVGEDEAAAIAVPTLVVGHSDDEIHPFAHAERLARLIPGASLVEICPKARDRRRYVAEFRAALAAFLETSSIT